MIKVLKELTSKANEAPSPQEVRLTLLDLNQDFSCATSNH